MSWLEKIENVKLEIITGDGVSYFPLWKNAERELEFNTEAFNFSGVSGSYVARKLDSGFKLPLLLWFSGEDNTENADTFMESAKDPRPWTVKHPYYNEILVQPLSLKQSNREHNITEITGTIWETLASKFPVITSNPVKEIEDKKTALDTNSLEASTVEIGTPSIETIQPAGLSIDVLGALYSAFDNAQELNNLIRTASGAALNLISDVGAYLQATQDLIDFPLSVENEAIFALTQIKKAITDLFFIIDLSYYDLQVSTLMSTACLVAIKGNYETKSEVLQASELLSDSYDLIIQTFDDNSYVQNDVTAQSLYTIINTTIQQLFEVAFSAKQERTHVLEQDDNIINLAFRFLGSGDDNLEKFMSWNNISISEILSIKKDREIIYYV